MRLSSLRGEIQERIRRAHSVSEKHVLPVWTGGELSGSWERGRRHITETATLASGF
jgi:endonuclease I